MSVNLWIWCPVSTVHPHTRDSVLCKDFSHYLFNFCIWILWICRGMLDQNILYTENGKEREREKEREKENQLALSEKNFNYTFTYSRMQIFSLHWGKTPTRLVTNIPSYMLQTKIGLNNLKIRYSGYFCVKSALLVPYKHVQ